MHVECRLHKTRGTDTLACAGSRGIVRKYAPTVVDKPYNFLHIAFVPRIDSVCKHDKTFGVLFTENITLQAIFARIKRNVAAGIRIFIMIVKIIGNGIGFVFSASKVSSHNAMCNHQSRHKQNKDDSKKNNKWHLCFLLCCISSLLYHFQKKKTRLICLFEVLSS